MERKASITVNETGNKGMKKRRKEKTKETKRRGTE
jgi:hypothetical protein